MTVVAYRDGVLAADTAAWQGDVIVEHPNKVKTNARYSWACCGAASQIAKFDRWANDYFCMDSLHRPTKDDDDFGAIIVHRDRRVWRCSNSFVLYEVTAHADFFVEGSSCQFMTGAMLAGASALGAVKAAIKYCAWAGGKCTAVNTDTGEYLP